jgi:hypothetical protein
MILKLTQNSVWGKLLERVDKRSTARLTTDPWRFYRQVCKKGCTGWEVLEGADGQPSENGFLGMYSMRPESVQYSSPRATAWAILDLSKVQLWTWWYECVKTLWPKAVFCYGDTDSALVSVPSESFLEDALKWNQEPKSKEIGPFDLSSFGINTWKGQLGAFKEELGQAEVQEAVFLCAKVYSLKMSDSDKCKAKGVPKAILNNYRFETYKQLLEDPTPVRETFEALRIVNQQSIKRTEIKKTLTAVNDKIWCQQVGEEWVTRPLGHYKNS